MTHERDIERLLDHWLSDGPTEAPNRVLDVVVDRIDGRSQRPAWRLDWRTISVNRTIGAVTAVAATILIAVVGVSLLGGRGGSSIGAPGSSPTPSPTTAPTSASPSATPVAASSSAAGVAGACDLLTADEAGNALHVTGAVFSESMGVDSPTTPSRYCGFQSGGLDILVLSYEKENGASVYAIWKQALGVQAVSGLGDDAVWDPTKGTLYILKGDRMVTIAPPNGPTFTLEAAKAVGAIVVGRM